MQPVASRYTNHTIPAPVYINTSLVFVYLPYESEDGLAKPTRVSELSARHKAMLASVYFCVCYLLTFPINHGDEMVKNG